MAVDEGTLRTEVRTFLLDNLLLARDPAELSDDASLVDLGVIDSTAVLEIVVFLEERYAFKVREAELLPENFGSVVAISSYAARRLAEAA